jgi:hypothetical protein
LYIGKGAKHQNYYVEVVERYVRRSNIQLSFRKAIKLDTKWVKMDCWNPINKIPNFSRTSIITAHVLATPLRLW